MRIGRDWTVKHKLAVKTHTRPYFSKRRSNFDTSKVAKRIEKFLAVISIKEDGSLEDHCLKYRIKSAIDSLTCQIGGSWGDIDEDLETLRVMRVVLSDLDRVEVERSQHDQGFFEMLKANDKLRRLASLELFDCFNRQMTLKINNE